MAPSNAGLQAGQVVSDTYEVERLLGRGGMGEVWLANHRRLKGKQVALKVLHGSGTAPDPEALARFRREAEIAARLGHPGIVEVLDFNTLEDGSPYLVMEYLRGESLAVRSKRARLSFDEIRHVVRHVGAALQVAHAAGVVHRDLKPENIFLTPTAVGDQVKVLDFGISKLSDSNSVQTTDSALLGTPLYMAPEQALGNNREVDGQSDVFSLGSICYELVAGQAPFEASNLATIVHKIAYEPHRPLKELAPSAPEEFLLAIDHALQKDKVKRTADVAHFVHELTLSTLTEVAAQPRDTISGVMSPGGQISESLLNAATVSAPGSAKATPGLAAVVPAAAPASAPTEQVRTPDSNPKGALFGAIGAAIVIAVAGFVNRTSTPQEPPVVPVVPAATNPTPPPPAKPVEEPPKAEVEAVEPAPTKSADPKPPEPPLTAEQLAKNTEILTELRALEAASDWHGIRERKGTATRNITGKAATAKVYLLLLKAECTEHSIGFMSVLGKLEELGLKRQGIALCKPLWPDHDWQ